MMNPARGREDPGSTGRDRESARSGRTCSVLIGWIARCKQGYEVGRSALAQQPPGEDVPLLDLELALGEHALALECLQSP